MQNISKLFYVGYRDLIIFYIKLLYLLYFWVLPFLRNYFILYTCKERNLIFAFVLFCQL